MLLVKNRRARYDYQIQKTWTAGIVLDGHEVKSLRLKHASLESAYTKIVGLEAWLINARIEPYKYASLENYDPKRTRKLLLTKKEIYQLIEADQKNQTIVPLEILLINNRIKVKIGVGRGKKQYEKRKKIKERDLKRQMSKKFKQKHLKF